MADEPKEAGSPQPQQRQIKLDEQNAVCSYANFCRVTGSPEELIVDFGLNSQGMNVTDKAIAINQRIVLNFYTAKRLLHALHLSVQSHEKVFGPLEIDVQKRVQPQPAESPQPKKDE
ncbi:MAG: DUF3467 domain-containing protein [Planctomycetota bacterium]|nr:DUF3467 domain-containing protein [Planctomycetota bacterium]